MESPFRENSSKNQFSITSNELANTKCVIEIINIRNMFIFESLPLGISDRIKNNTKNPNTI